MEAARRELMEEAGVESNGRLILFGLYGNDVNFPGDHMALYVLDGFAQRPRPASLEIAEKGFFAPEAFPSVSPRDAAAAGGDRRAAFRRPALVSGQHGNVDRHSDWCYSAAGQVVLNVATEAIRQTWAFF